MKNFRRLNKCWKLALGINGLLPIVLITPLASNTTLKKDSQKRNANQSNLITTNALSDSSNDPSLFFSNGSDLTGSIQYDINDTNLTITKVTAKSGSWNDLTLNSTVQITGQGTYTITKILGLAFQNQTKITGKFTLPSTISEIGSSAFENCSISTIDLSACSNISSIGIYAFMGCPLNAIITPDDTGASGWGYTYQYRTCIYTNDKNEEVGKTVIEHTDTTYAPTGCLTCGAITLPADVTSLNSDDYHYCNGLTSIDLSSCINLTSIPNDTFNSCTRLKNIKFSTNGVSSIGNSSFDYCSSLASIDLSNCKNLTLIDGYAFRGSGLKTLDLSKCEGLQKIEYNAFDSCSQLTSIVFANATQNYTITTSSFQNCTALTTIDFRQSTTTIPTSSYFPNNCFNSYKNANFIIPTNSNKEIIGAWFDRLSGMIGDGDVPNVCYETDASDWAEGNITSGTIEVKLKDRNASSFTVVAAHNLVATNLSLKESLFTAIGDNAFMDNDQLIGSITIPSSIESIGANAFYDCTALNRCIFKDDAQLTNIGNQAFEYSGLSSLISIPESVNTIGANVFNGCSQLNKIQLNWDPAVFSRSNSLNIDSTWLGDLNVDTVTIYVPKHTKQAYIDIAPTWGMENCRIEEISPDDNKNNALALGLGLGLGLGIPAVAGTTTGIVLGVKKSKKNNSKTNK